METLLGHWLFLVKLKKQHLRSIEKDNAPLLWEKNDPQSHFNPQMIKRHL